MIKLESKYNKKTEICSVKADCKNTNTFEHIYAIVHLIENILKNDPTTSYQDVVDILNLIFISKEEKKDVKRNNKSKA